MFSEVKSIECLVCLFGKFVYVESKRFNFKKSIGYYKHIEMVGTHEQHRIIEF